MTNRERRGAYASLWLLALAFGWIEASVVIYLREVWVSAGLTLVAFLAGSSAVIDHRLGDRFPQWVFWSGVILGVGWFASVERREAQVRERREPWVSVRVRTLAPTDAEAPSMIRSVPPVEGAIEELKQEHDLDRIVARYRDAANRLGSLVDEASELAERLERLAHGLSTRPGHLIVGLPHQDVENPNEWDIVPSHPLPSIEQLAVLTDSIRAEGARVEKLRQRLILMGHADLVEHRNGFFH